MSVVALDDLGLSNAVGHHPGITSHKPGVAISGVGLTSFLQDRKTMDKQAKELAKLKHKLDKEKKKAEKESLKAQLKQLKHLKKRSTSVDSDSEPTPASGELLSLPTPDEILTTSDDSTHSSPRALPASHMSPNLMHTLEPTKVESKHVFPVSPPQEKRTKLTDFRVITLIGKGGFGEVYLVESRKNHQKLALKVIEKKLIAEQKKIQHILNERDVLIKSKVNPYLVHLSYSFQDENYIYMAMEFCPGGDLRSLFYAAGPLPEEEARFYVAEMIMAVHSLHEMGYIHRDLKPDNFLIDAEGHLKLADFGLSKEGVVSNTDMKRMRSRQSILLGEQDFKTLTQENFNHRFTRTRSQASVMRPSRIGSMMLASHVASGSSTNGFHDIPLMHSYVPPTEASREKQSRRRLLAYSIVGSPDYMSPEVLTESGYTQEADWWSVGCNLFEMLMGHPPFSADTPEEVFENITNWRTVLPELLEQYREYLGPDCLDLIAGLLSEPSQRLGANGIDEIRRHKFFASVDWSNLRKETPPFIPKLSSDEDTSYFNDNVADIQGEIIKRDPVGDSSSAGRLTPPIGDSGSDESPTLSRTDTVPLNRDSPGKSRSDFRHFSYAESDATALAHKAMGSPPPPILPPPLPPKLPPPPSYNAPQPPSSSNGLPSGSLKLSSSGRPDRPAPMSPASPRLGGVSAGSSSKQPQSISVQNSTLRRTPRNE